MLVIDLNDPRPLYQQVVDGIKSNIATGELRPEHPLPSVRDLAESLAINPNTIARAYRELQSAGVIRVRQGKGAWVAQPPQAPDAQTIAEFRSRLRRLLADAFHLGLTGDDVLQLLQNEIEHSEEQL